MGHYSVYMCVMVFLLFRVTESEHTFMRYDSQDDFLISGVRNACIYTYIHILEID